MDHREFAQIYNKYFNNVWHICIMYMKNKQDAEDALQETFLKYYNSNIMFENEFKERKWLIVTSGNICKNMLKKWYRKNEQINCYENELRNDQQQIDTTLDLVMKLPDKYKIPVYLYYYMEYDSSEIAVILKKPKSTIRNYLMEARKQLREVIDEG